MRICYQANIGAPGVAGNTGKGHHFAHAAERKIVSPVKKDQKTFILFSFKKAEPKRSEHATTDITVTDVQGPVIEEPSSVTVPCRVCMEAYPGQFGVL